LGYRLVTSDSFQSVDVIPTASRLLAAKTASGSF
jgi:hypothetical protein